MKLTTVFILLLCCCLAPAFGQTATASLQNIQVSGNQITFDIYAKNTGSSIAYLVDCSLYIKYNDSKFTSPTITFASELPSLTYGSNVALYSTNPKSFGIDITFGPTPTTTNTVQLSSSGNGTKLGTVTMTGLTTFTGTADIAWGTTFPSQIFRWNPQSGSSSQMSGTYTPPPDVYLGPVYNVELRNQAIDDEQYTFDVFLKKTGGQPLYLGNSTLKIGFNSSKFSSPSATVVSRGTTRLADFYTYATQVQGTTLTLTITAPATSTQAEFDNRIQTISNVAGGTRIATISISGLSSPVSILDITPSWQTNAGTTVIRTRRNVSNWTAADDVTASGTFSVEAPVPTLALISPNGGQALCSGVVQPVQWTSDNVQRVKLELVPESGTPVVVASSLSATSGTYSWTVPPTAGVFRMRISDAARPTLNDISDNTFSIQIAGTIITQPVSQTVCKGATVTFNSAASGTPAPTAQWQVSTDGSSWQNAAGGTSASLVLPSVQPSMSGNRYRVKYTSACAGEATSAVVTLTVNEAPSFLTQIPSKTACAGENIDFSLQASGTPTPSIQWQVSVNGGSNWTDIPGATTSTLSLPSVQLSMNGRVYRAVLSNSCGQNVLSNNAMLTVNAAPVVTQHPESVSSCSGFTVVLLAAASGTPAPSVRWQVSTTGGSDWADIPGATITELTLSGLTSAMSGRMYRAAFTNACTTAFTNPATLTVGTAVQITVQPQSVTVCEGTTAVIAVSATGSPEPTVVWQQSTDGSNWTAVAGQTTKTLTLPGVTASMNGRMYRAVLSNLCTQALTTATAILTVNTAPRITAQPQEVITCTGETVVYHVGTAGSPAPSIQWQMRADNGQWQNMPGQTAADLQLPSVQSPQNGSQYRVVLANSCGTAMSDAAALWLFNKPSVSLQPQNVSVCEDGTALLQVGAAGLPQPTIQWQTSLTGGASWNDMPQSTSAVLTIADVDRSLDNTLFRAVLTNTCGSVVSEQARLSVNTAPEMVGQPVSTTACVDGGAVFTASATGNPAPAVKWQSSFDGGATWVDVVGAVSNTLQILDIRITQNQARYRPVYSNICGEVVGNFALLTVLTAPRITTQPVSQTVVVEQSVQFSVDVEVAGAVSYQWYRGGTALNDNDRFTGTKTRLLTINNVRSTDVDNAYFAIVIGACGADTSDFAALNINVPGISIASQPQPVAVCQGGNVEFSISASTDVSGASLSYQWRRGSTDLVDGGKYSGVHTSVLRIADASAAEAATNYNVRITVNPGGASTYSHNAVLRVDVLPSITARPISVAVCEGAPAVVEVGASGTAPLQYRWLRNGEEIPNATGARYVIHAVNAQTIGEYECVVSNGCGSASSETAVVSLKQHTQVVVQPQDVAGTLGRDFALDVSASGAGTLSYQWYRNGELVPGATQSKYTNVVLDASSAGEYYCIVRGECGSDTTDTVVVSIAVGVPEYAAHGDVLGQNYPNPFGISTTVPVVLAADGYTELVVRDAFGRELLVLHRGFLAAGQHLFTISAEALPSGVYFCTLTAGGRTTTRSMILAK